jgi:hypothetical protein
MAVRESCMQDYCVAELVYAEAEMYTDYFYWQ